MALVYTWISVLLLPALVGVDPGVPPVRLVEAHWAVIALEFFGLSAGGILLTHLLRWRIHRGHWQALRLVALALRVLLAGLMLALPLGVAEHNLAVGGLRDYPAVTPLWAELLNRSLNWALLIWVWAAIYFGIVGSRRRRLAELRQSELARALQLAELRLLKSQLNPHFLFNSLNSVRALIADDPVRAQSAVTQLARILRYSLASNQDELVTLEHELEIVDDYLALEQLRLGDRLRVERDVAPAAARARIPVMLLQTVVENAIKHGVAELSDGGVLRISAQLRDAALLLDVENPRPPDAAPPNDEGIGLRNAQQRLRLLFGEAARLELDLSAPDRARTQIRIPAPA